MARKTFQSATPQRYAWEYILPKGAIHQRPLDLLVLLAGQLDLQEEASCAAVTKYLFARNQTALEPANMGTTAQYMRLFSSLGAMVRHATMSYHPHNLLSCK